MTSRGSPARRLLRLAALPLLLLVAGCGTAPAPSPTTLLSQVKGQLASLTSVHFAITSHNATGSGIYVTGGTGDARRPDQLTGTFSITDNGLPLSLDVVSVSSGFYIKDPLTGRWETVNPQTYNFANPATLLDPTNGLTSLLDHATNLSSQPTDRYNGEELYEIRCNLPGSGVAQLLQDAQPSQPVTATLGVDTSTKQLRRLVVTGPLITAGQQATYTIILTHYGESVSVTAPST